MVNIFVNKVIFCYLKRLNKKKVKKKYNKFLFFNFSFKEKVYFYYLLFFGYF